MKTANTSNKLIIVAIFTALQLTLGGCAVVPKDLDSNNQDDGHFFSRKVVSTFSDSSALDTINTHHTIASNTDFFLEPTFARGDILRVRIADMDQFDGLYQITAKGTLELPFAPALVATGQSRKVLTQKIQDELVRLKWFYKESVNVDLSLVQMAAVNVSVIGAVFNPGRVMVNSRPNSKPQEVIQQASGVFSSGRDLVSALGAAGGIRPDADLSEVYLKRGNKVLHVPLNKLIDGNGFGQTPLLIEGDQIIIHSTGVVNAKLIKPSQITPPGMRVFMSNLTAPSLSNAQAAVGSASTSLPYGSSLLDSVISANCIGGTHQANASRSVVLITRNFGSNQQLVVSRTINQLLANSSNHMVNPFVMPNDGLACYDSKFTNFRDVARGIGEVISPIILGRLL